MDIIYLTLIAYILFFLGYSFYASRKESREDFIIAGRNQGFWPLVLSMNSTWFNMAWMTFALSIIMTDAFSYVWMMFGWALSTFMLYKIAPKIRENAEEFSISSLSEYVYACIGTKSGYICAALNFFLYMGWLTVELVASSHVVSSLFGVSYNVALFSLVGLVLGYLLLGGFKVLVKTDVLQFILFFIFIAIAYTFVPFDSPVSWDVLASSFSYESGVSAYWMMFFAGAPAILLGSEVWQRLLAANSDKTAKKVVAWSMPLSFVMYVPIFALPFLVSPLFLPENSAGVIEGVIKTYLPLYMAPFALVFILAVITSTLDTAGFVAGQSIANDGLAKRWLDKHDRGRFVLRLGIVSVFAIAVSFALFYQNVVEIMYFILNMWAVLPPIVVGLVFGKHVRDISCALSLLLLALFMLIVQVLGFYEDWMTSCVFISGFILPYVFDFIFVLLESRKGKA